ncbi:MAG TPA: branched-chain amino acid ABC transporter permease, partial [Acidimicrobiia bacterium]|nr:branched-chain amino acid ABC transporter permease [Acidimicrobiia bacterium]
MIHRECGVIKTTYRADMALYPLPLARVTVAVTAALLVAVPWLLPPKYLVWASLTGISAIGAVGLNLLTGSAGLISLGHGAFLATGAYTAANLAARLDAPFWLALPLAGLVAAALGLVVGLPSMRVKGIYLAVATIAAQFMTEWVINHVTWISGGAQATVSLPPPALGPLQIDTEAKKYLLILAVAAIGVVVALNISRSRLGRAFVAVRDRDLAADVIGVEVGRTKLAAFAVSSAYAGVAGALWAYYLGVANYEMFSITVSIEYLSMVILGGLGSVVGSVYGAAFVTILPLALRDFLERFRDLVPVDDVATFVAQLRLIFFGSLIIAFLVTEPEGLARLWRKVKDYFRL